MVVDLDIKTGNIYILANSRLAQALDLPKVFYDQRPCPIIADYYNMIQEISLADPKYRIPNW